jgi:hypothetical protein
MPNNVSKNIYIHQNFNRNELREFLLENANYNTRPTPSTGEDKGLMYFDTDINRIIVWNGVEWKIVKYFDDRDFESNDNIKLSDIWADSPIVANLSENEAKGLTGSQVIVQYWQNRTTANIPGSWSYYTNEMESVILPKIFANGVPFPDFYKPIVKNYLGIVIDDQYYMLNEYKVNNKSQYRIEFLDGKRMSLLNVSPANPPTITFYKYIGTRLTLTSVNSTISKFEYRGSDFSIDPNNNDRQRVALTGTGVENISQVLSLSVNGQQLSSSNHYIVYQESSVYYISIDFSDDTGTGWENEGGLNSDDYVYLNVFK